MYELFQQAGTPLPKDPNLIDYGFNFSEDFEERQQKAIEECEKLKQQHTENQEMNEQN